MKLAPAASAADAIARAQADDIKTVQPEVVQTDNGPILRIRDDAGYVTTEEEIDRAADLIAGVNPALPVFLQPVFDGSRPGIGAAQLGRLHERLAARLHSVVSCNLLDLVHVHRFGLCYVSFG